MQEEWQITPVTWQKMQADKQREITDKREIMHHRKLTKLEILFQIKQVKPKTMSHKKPVKPAK